MRIDRVLAEGEAVSALRRMGFDVREADGRPGLYEVSHPQIGGMRVFTIEQLCCFGEGATVIETHLRTVAASTGGGQPMYGGGSGGM